MPLGVATLAYYAPYSKKLYAPNGLGGTTGVISFASQSFWGDTGACKNQGFNFNLAISVKEVTVKGIGLPDMIAGPLNIVP